ncbi:MAG: dihydrolipoyl dehydrogenase [Betaproteobacteria bacterium]|nr:dihydrolipoyl dehydrogenase [Betaproteobacteria bacterium]MDH5352229.1 dihydrolipoyl dehydrogenase [Betaproteobacteria bacterium]
MAQSFDVVVIGGGPGGYIAAIRAAQLGMTVACVDEWKGADGKPALGGTCTNIGCIPSKALLQSSENYEQAGHGFAEHGVKVKGLELDLAQMLKRKDKVVKQNNDGITYLFKKNKVAFFHGRGSFGASPSEIRVGKETLSATHVIVATGSSARALPGAEFDEKLILSNDGALAMAEVPKRLGIIGAGVIGLELGSVWRRLGAQVTILEALPAFLGAADEQIAKEAAKVFAKQGLDIQLGVKISKVSVSKKSVSVQYNTEDISSKVLECDRLIVSIGRVPNTEGLNAEGVGLKLDERGFVEVDGDCRTSLPNVWAIGDVVRGPMLAHKAEEEGAAVAERIAGRKPHVDFNTVPWVIYTAPEIAWVGKTEQQLKADGIEYRAGTFPFSANGRARALGESAGLVKFLAHAQTDEILGVHVMGPFAGELIAEAVVAMEFRGSSEDIGMICHAHPTLSEAMKEAALAVDKRALNL